MTRTRTSVPRPHALRRVAFTLAALAVLGSVGCQFNSGDKSTPKNVCNVDTDCTGTSTCLDGMCVGKNDTTLDLTVEVTPTRMPDGSQSVPIAFGPFAVRGSSHRNIELPQPIVTAGNVREGKKHLAADLHFTPVRSTGAPLPGTQLVTTNDVAADAPASSAPDFTVQLLLGVTYHVVVEPNDTTLPPYALDFTAAAGKTLTIDYAAVHWTGQRFYVQGVPDGQNLVLHAVDAQSGEPISSSAHVTSAPTVLVFGPKPIAEYRLVITSQDSYETAEKQGSACDLTTPVFPMLRIAQSALKDDETGTHVFVMPQIPVPIRYSGVVQLCPGTKATGTGDMPMALDARTLHWSGDDGIDASYNATTTAQLDQASGQLRFCTRVLPGDYVVVITPPANLACEIFAESQQIDSPTGTAVSDVQLTLHAAPALDGTIETPDGMPVNDASVEAHALGRDFMLSKTDPSVTSYNRSTQTASDAEGKFHLPIDIGSYDVVLKPAPDSNYAWQVLHDVNIDARNQAFSTHVTLDAPFAINGKVSYANSNTKTQQSLAGAEVQAFIQIQSNGVSRSIEVARTVADQNGEITLLVSPQPHAGL